MDDKKKVLREIENTQKECSHKEGYVVKFIDSSNDVRCVCKICQKVIGHPSEQELIDNGFK